MHKATMPPAAPARPTSPRFRAMSASGPAAARAALDLRARVFRNGAADADRFDTCARHLTVQEVATGRTVAACRVFLHADRAAAARGYTGQHYDLRGLAMARAAPLLEVGRVCIVPDLRAHPDPPRLLLGRIAALALASGAGLLLGCTSFPGADPQRHAAALGYLWRHHRAAAGQGVDAV
ncbi:MAG: GNAT family N-acetyltransferase, partial [Rhodobacteraceae bacterium]|nr:GNAT family N-acetyltransferase [Paracoccaceae bacterium]